MEYYQLLAGLALGRLHEDNGSGPPPAVPDHVADQRAGRARREQTSAPDTGRRRKRGITGRPQGSAPAVAT